MNKALLYSTGNPTQYSLITYKGKESEKEQIYACFICMFYMHVIYIYIL